MARGRKKKDEEDLLKHRVYTRIHDKKFKEFQAILAQDHYQDMSSLLRDVLYKTPIVVRTRDGSMEKMIEELAVLRSELKAIGVNINQITRHFNTYPDMQRKQFFAKIGLTEFIQTKARMDAAIDLIAKVGKRWLSE